MFNIEIFINTATDEIHQEVEQVIYYLHAWCFDPWFPQSACQGILASLCSPMSHQRMSLCDCQIEKSVCMNV